MTYDGSWSFQNVLLSATRVSRAKMDRKYSIFVSVTWPVIQPKSVGGMSLTPVYMRYCEDDLRDDVDPSYSL